MTFMNRKRFAGGRVGTPREGPYMTIVVSLDRTTVIGANYNTYPCPSAHACGNFAASWAVGKTLSDLANLSSTDIQQAVGKMPLGREHCPDLVVNAFADLLQREKEKEVSPSSLVDQEHTSEL